MAGVKTLKSVRKALDAIGAIADHQPVGVGALARALDLDKSAVQRILVTLHEAGWIEAAPGDPRRWQLSLKPLVVARHVDAAGLVDRARPLLERLRDETGETVLLAEFDGTRLAVVEVVESPQPLRMSLRIGTELPVYPSASGKAVLARLAGDALRGAVGGPLPDDLEEELAAVRERGYATNVGEVDASAHTVAAAVAGPGSHPLGAVVVATPATRMPPERLRSLGASLVELAAQLSGEDATSGRPESARPG